MNIEQEDFSPMEAGLEPLLTLAMQRALDYRRSVGDSDAKPAQTFAEVCRAFSGPVPEVGESGLEVIEKLAGLQDQDFASPSARVFSAGSSAARIRSAWPPIG
jgi:hypothetical protein